MKALSAEFVDVGYRDGFVVETTLNIDSFVYLVGGQAEYSYSYGLGVGYQGSTYSGVFAFSQVIGDVNQYKGELQVNYIDANLIAFVHLGLYTERTDLAYKIGAGWPINEKTAITSYISDRGFFFGFRRTM